LHFTKRKCNNGVQLPLTTNVLKRAGVVISMDGRGRAFDNIFVERLWRSVKYEDIYLKGYATMGELVIGLTAYFAFYNEERPHQSLTNQTPDKVYQTASGGGAIILEKYGDSLPEMSDPLRSSDVSGRTIRNNKVTAPKKVKTGQRRAAASELEPTA
jgi:putative transposase